MERGKNRVVSFSFFFLLYFLCVFFPFIFFFFFFFFFSSSDDKRKQKKKKKTKSKKKQKSREKEKRKKDMKFFCSEFSLIIWLCLFYVEKKRNENQKGKNRRRKRKGIGFLFFSFPLPVWTLVQKAKLRCFSNLNLIATSTIAFEEIVELFDRFKWRSEFIFAISMIPVSVILRQWLTSRRSSWRLPEEKLRKREEKKENGRQDG